MCETKENLISEIKNINDLEDPVFYCQHCLNLKIIQAEKTNQSYCGTCGNLDILLTDISDWENLYLKRYGRKYLEQEKVQIFAEVNKRE
jgi:hypothetical protein